MNTQHAPQQVIVARRRMFSAAHLYRQKKFTPAENSRVFGLCYTERGHGHNYVVEAFIAGPIDPKTRLVMNLTDLDRVLDDAVKPLEHHHLNFDVPEFADLVPTTENIALYLRDRIKAALRDHATVELQRLRLFETDSLWVEVWG